VQCKNMPISSISPSRIILNLLAIDYYLAITIYWNYLNNFCHVDGY